MFELINLQLDYFLSLLRSFLIKTDTDIKPRHEVPLKTNIHVHVLGEAQSKG